MSITPKVTTKAYTNPKFKTPAVVAGCFAGRRAGFFIWNVMLIMVCKFLTSLGFPMYSSLWFFKKKVCGRLVSSFCLYACQLEDLVFVKMNVDRKNMTGETFPWVFYLKFVTYVLHVHSKKKWLDSLSLIYWYILCNWIPLFF